MKRLFLLFIFIPCMAFSQPFGQGKQVIVTNDTLNIDKQSRYTYFYTVDNLFYFSGGGILKQIATESDSISLANVYVDTLKGRLQDSIFVADDLVALYDILFEGTTSNKMYFEDTDGDTVIVIDPNVSGNPSIYMMDGTAADSVRIYHDGTNLKIIPDAGTTKIDVDGTLEADSLNAGGSTDYVGIGNATTGMINVVAASAGDYTVLKVSGAGINDGSDYIIYIGAYDNWKGSGKLSATQLEILQKAVINDSLRVEETVLIKGALTANVHAIVNDSLRVEETSLLKGAVTANTKLVVNDSLRVEETSLLKGTVTTAADISVGTKAVVNDSLRVEETALIKGALTANLHAIVNDSLRVEETSLLKGDVTLNEDLFIDDSLDVDGVLQVSPVKDSVAINGKLYVSGTASLGTISADSLNLRELTVTDSAYVDTLTTAVARVTGKAVIEDSLRVDETSRFVGASTFGATATPLQILTTGDIRSTSTAGHRLRMDGIGATLDQTKSLLLENQTAAAAGAQQMSPALVFKGNGWKTDATAGSDSVKWAIYNLPVQGAAAPTGQLQFQSKIGSSSWGSKAFLTTDGSFNSQYAYHGNYVQTGSLLSLSASSDITIGTVSGSSKSVIFTTNSTERARIISTGEVGIGTTAPVSNSLTLGTNGTQRDLIVTRENTPAGIDSSLRAYVLAGNGRYVAKATDADSVYLTVDADSARLGSNNPLSIAGGITNTGNALLKGTVTVENPMTLGKNTGTSGQINFVASDNDQANIAINTSDQITLNGSSGGVLVSGTGSSATGLIVDGNKTSGNLLQIINDNDGVAGDSTVLVTPTGMVRQSTTWHAYGGFEDSSITVDLTQNVWAQATNAYGSMFTLVEGDGFSMSVDTMTVTNTGDYTGNISLTMSGSNNDELYIRIYNVTQNDSTFAMGFTGVGNTAFRNVSMAIYIEATAGDELVLQLKNADSNDDVILRSAVFYLAYLHD